MRGIKWNVIERDEVTIFLNGVLVNHASNVKLSKGRIQIQSEGAEIFFRKVEPRTLKKKLDVKTITLKKPENFLRLLNYRV